MHSCVELLINILWCWSKKTNKQTNPQKTAPDISGILQHYRKRGDSKPEIQVTFQVSDKLKHVEYHLQ